MIRRSIPAAIIGLFLALLTTPAFADSGTVIYSYEKIEVGDSVQWVLLPKAELSLKGKPTATHIKRAFTALKKAKRSTYAGSAIAVSGNAPATAKVTVKIDARVAKYSLIIIAETVATLTEMGVKEVSFPGYTSGPMQRHDVPFPYYAMVVPLWRALPDLATDHINVMMPDGSLRSSKEVAKLWKSKDPSVVNALYAYLKASDPYTVVSVAKALPDLKVPYAEQIAGLLKDSRSTVRENALTILESERNNTVVADAVVSFLKVEKDPKLAVAGAEFLGKVKDKKYAIEKPFYYLAKGDEKASLAAASELAKFKDDRSVPALKGHLTDKRKAVAAAAATSIDKLGAADEQLAALKNAKIDSEVRLQIARDLAGHKVVAEEIAGLDYLVEQSAEDESTKAIVTMNDIKDDAARTTLESYVVSDKRWVRRTAADALTSRGKVESVAALAKAVKAKKDAEMMEAAGYQIMVGQSLKTVLDQTAVKDNIVKRIAYSALGERAQKEKKSSGKVFKILTDGLGNRDPLIRGACARAIGAFGDTKAAKALKGVIADKSADVRKDVAVAMGNFKGAELLEPLNAYLNDKSPDVQAAAVISLGQRGEAGSWKTFKEMTKHKSPAVRASAMTTLARLVSRSDKQGVGEVISTLSGGVTDDALEVRVAAVKALGTFKEDNAVTGIALQLNTDEEDLRLAAIEALGDTGHPSAIGLADSVAGDPNKKVRREAIVALGKLGAKAELNQRAKSEKDEDLKKLIGKALKGK